MTTPNFKGVQARRKIEAIRLMACRSAFIDVDMVRAALCMQRSTAYGYLNHMIAAGVLRTTDTPGQLRPGPFSAWRNDGKPIRVFSRMNDGQQAHYPVRRDAMVAALFGSA